MYTLHYAPDNASLIIRIALLELGVPFDCVLVDRRQKAQKTPAYLAINPAGRIPALVTSSGPIFETGAILQWLIQRHGDYPQTGQFLKWLFFLSNTLHADLRALFYPNEYVDDPVTSGFRAKTHARIDGHLQLINEHCTTWDSDILDIYLSVMVRWCQLYPVNDNDWFDITRYPNILRLAKSVETRASVKNAITAEGLNDKPFSAAQHPNPPEGSAI